MGDHSCIELEYHQENRIVALHIHLHAIQLVHSSNSYDMYSGKKREVKGRKSGVMITFVGTFLKKTVYGTIKHREALQQASRRPAPAAQTRDSRI